jgi:hypothetical protein
VLRGERGSFYISATGAAASESLCMIQGLFVSKACIPGKGLLTVNGSMKDLMMPAMSGLHRQGAALNVFAISSFQKQVRLENTAMK